MKRLLFIVFVIALPAITIQSCSNQSSTGDKNSSSTLANPGKSKADTTLQADEKYTCTMHQEVISDHPGECPKCGMTLVKQKITADQQKMLQDGNYVKPKD